MGVRRVTVFKYAALGLAFLVVVGIAAAAWHNGALPIGEWWNKLKPGTESGYGGQRIIPGKLVGQNNDTLELAQDIARSIGVQTATVREAAEPRKLKLEGSLALSPERSSHVRARFPGEVVGIGEVEERVPGTLLTGKRPLRLDDRVVKGQVLAVIWNTDLGNKKNDLIDAISQLRVDRNQYERLEKLYKQNSISLATLEAKKRDVEVDQNNVARLERTLRSLRVTEEEIRAVKEEAERILTPEGKRKENTESNWARVEIRSPIDGTIVEKNFILGDIINDTSFDLFKITNVDKLAVMAHVYEEDLKALHSLSPEQRYWTVNVDANRELKLPRSRIDIIGPVLDPNQHTAVVMGEIDNPRHLLHSAQFVTATVDLPPEPDEVVIPATALIEDGQESIVFLKLDPKNLPDADPKKDYFEQRRVVVTRREQKQVFIRSRLASAQEKKGSRALNPGEVVVIEGAITLEGALEDLQATVKR